MIRSTPTELKVGWDRARHAGVRWGLSASLWLVLALAAFPYATLRADDAPRGLERGAPVSWDSAGYLGVQFEEETRHVEGGARVTRVVEGSPADRAGIRVRDIIVEFDGNVVRGPVALTRSIHATAPGDVVEIALVRGGDRQSVELELGERPGRIVLRSAPWVRTPLRLLTDEDSDAPLVIAPEILERFEVEPLPGIVVPQGGGRLFGQILPEVLGSWGKPRLGVQLVETTPELREHLGGSEQAGVLISKVLAGSPAQRAGLEVGDLILRVDGEPVSSSAELVVTLGDKVGKTFPVEIARDRQARTIEVTIPEPEADRPTGPRA